MLSPQYSFGSVQCARHPDDGRTPDADGSSEETARAARGEGFKGFGIEGSRSLTFGRLKSFGIDGSRILESGV